VTLDQSSIGTARRRRAQLSVALGIAVLACASAVAALIGGSLRAVPVVIGTILTAGALLTSMNSWRAAADVWSGTADPATLHSLTRRSLLPSVPALVISGFVLIFVGVPPGARVFSGSPTNGNGTWPDRVLLVSLALYLIASAGAALYPLRVRR
jgi:hypothetical protein